MKYQTLGTRLLGYLSPSTNVVITLVDVKLDVIIHTTSNVCQESTSLPGLYIFNTNNIDITLLDDVYKTTGLNNNHESLEIAYVMTNELGEKYGGKIVIDNDLRLLIQINNSLSNIPDNVWNLLSTDEQISYKNILKRIYQSTDLIPALV